MRVLVACEDSGVVREAFRARGHDAYSCDLLPAEDGSPYHYRSTGDTYLKNLIEFLEWDLMIAHPPCTYLCNSGVSHLHPRKALFPEYELWLQGLIDWSEGRAEYDRLRMRWESLYLAQAFFQSLLSAPIPRICIENPIPHKYANLPPYTQTIQPYQFGDDASKRTCLWLKNLPPLSIPSPTSWIPPRLVDGKKRWANQTDSGQNKETPSPTRGQERARTYQGIANAFAENWG